LALTSITLNTTATISNGSALAQNGAVTMDTNTISIYSAAPNFLTLTSGLDFNAQGQVEVVGSGGQVLAVVPEPASLTMLGVGVFSIAGSVWRRRKKGATAFC
jgi:hypothetical protein